jgi:hypothetical protein
MSRKLEERFRSRKGALHSSPGSNGICQEPVSLIGSSDSVGLFAVPYTTYGRTMAAVIRLSARPYPYRMLPPGGHTVRYQSST